MSCSPSQALGDAHLAGGQLQLLAVFGDGPAGDGDALFGEPGRYFAVGEWAECG